MYRVIYLRYFFSLLFCSGHTVGFPLFAVSLIREISCIRVRYARCNNESVYFGFEKYTRIHYVRMGLCLGRCLRAPHGTIVSYLNFDIAPDITPGAICHAFIQILLLYSYTGPENVLHGNAERLPKLYYFQEITFIFTVLTGRICNFHPL